MKDMVFALDIGTRKVMGLVGRRREELLEIIDMEVIEHPSRPMLDGQIHSIDEVARTVRKIKERLEERLQSSLSRVGVAVAGRNLLTFRGNASKDFLCVEEVTEAMVRDLEMEAVGRIIEEAGGSLSEFYCVGYTPVAYELEGSRIGSPAGHRAKSISCEVIGTFLPRIVLDSIFAVLKKAKLEASNITLEPIAALNAIVPPEMRTLNIVLVDIGAGTSDIAITRNGTVCAYGMVPIAGDEITEHISENLLSDFGSSEIIKRAIMTHDVVDYEDIWSRRRRIDVGSLRKIVEPAVRRLAEAIAAEAKSLNGSGPQAVVLVGGGSQTPGLIDELAAAFQLPSYKVGIRLPHVIKQVKDITAKLNGPEAVTPIGIAMMTERSGGLHFVDIEVNGTKVPMLDLAQKKDVIGALTLSGIVNRKKLFSRPGLSMTVTVGSELRVIKGTFGTPAQIMVNGSAVPSLTEKVSSGDKIEFIEAVDGKDAQARICDIIPDAAVTVVYNGQKIELGPAVLMNGQRVDGQTCVVDRAVIELITPAVEDLLTAKGIDVQNLSERQVLVNIDGAPRILVQRNFTLRLNGANCERSTHVKDGDEIEFSLESPTHYRIRDVVAFPDGLETMRVKVDDKDIEVVINSVQVFMNGHQVTPDEFLIDGADIRVYHAKERTVLLSDIFKYIDFDPLKVMGKSFRLFVDDVPAGFTTPLAEGSRVRIVFEDRRPL